MSVILLYWDGPSGEGNCRAQACRRRMTGEVWQVNPWWAESGVEALAGPGRRRNSGLGGQVRHSLPPLI